MGSGASSSTFNVDECKIVCGEMFDMAKFNEIKDARGKVTLDQLNKAYEERTRRDDENGKSLVLALVPIDSITS